MVAYREIKYPQDAEQKVLHKSQHIVELQYTEKNMGSEYRTKPTLYVYILSSRIVRAFLRQQRWGILGKRLQSMRMSQEKV